MPAGEADAGGSQTLERGLAVLELLGRHPEGLSTSQVAVASGLHRSIVHRLLVSLHRTGFASRDEAGRFTVGAAAHALADRGRPSLRTVAEPVLQRLAGRIDATASLVEVIGGSAVTTVVAEPPTDGPRFSYRLGNRDPLDRGAGGLAALAAGPPHPGEPARVPEIRAAGHVVTRAELHPGAIGIAAPLLGTGFAAALNVVTAHEELVRVAIPALLEGVEAIRERLGRCSTS